MHETIIKLYACYTNNYMHWKREVETDIVKICLPIEIKATFNALKYV